MEPCGGLFTENISTELKLVNSRRLHRLLRTCSCWNLEVVFSLSDPETFFTFNLSLDNLKNPKLDLIKHLEQEESGDDEFNDPNCWLLFISLLFHQEGPSDYQNHLRFYRISSETRLKNQEKQSLFSWTSSPDDRAEEWTVLLLHTGSSEIQTKDQEQNQPVVTDLVTHGLNI